MPPITWVTAREATVSRYPNVPAKVSAGVGPTHFGGLAFGQGWSVFETVSGSLVTVIAIGIV